MRDKAELKKERQARMANARAAKAAKKRDESHAVVASIEDASSKDQKSLLSRIADLEAQLKASNQKRSVAEQAQLAEAQAQGSLMQRGISEVPTGRTVKLQRCTDYTVVGHKDDGREIRKPVFEQVPVPTFFYKIDLPPIGSNQDFDLKINGTPFYHGAVYEFDLDTLRTVKEHVFRLWQHEENIHGKDEHAAHRGKNRFLSQRV